MKKCPVCDKTFDDSMRFCQTDGTPLIEDIPEDPYKTMVAGKDDIAAAIPPPTDDPFKTMVAGGSLSKEEDNLLQIPEENFDPLKTMVNPQGAGQDAAVKEEINIEPIKDAPTPPPYSPFDNAATPSQPPSFGGAENVSDLGSPLPPPPSPPKFNEPDIAPPPFPSASSQTPFSSGNVDDSSDESTTNDQTVMYPSSPLPPLSRESSSSEPPPTILGGDSPFGSPPNEPIPSPFSEAPTPSYETPPSPPLPSYKEPEPPPFGNLNDPFNQPSFNQGENINQNIQQQDWNPPPAPDANWQNQNVGQNTPFQPPPAGQGLNQTLPIISLVLGIVSLCCYIAPLTGTAALITGFLGMKNANNDPSQYGGKGLAIAGMICGGVFLLLGLLVYLYWILIVGSFGFGVLGGM